MGRAFTFIRNTLRPSAFHYVMMIAGAVFLLSFGIRTYFGDANQGLEVEFRDRAERTSSPTPSNREIEAKIYYGDDDRFARYAERLRDASQIAISLGLYTVRERMANRAPSDVQSVLIGLAKTALMPANASLINSGGIMMTTNGLYYIRYRPHPLAFEVLAVGAKGFEDGAVFIVRLPEATGTIAQPKDTQAQPGAYATVFVSPFNNATLPVPFSPPSVFRAAGWSQEPLRSSPVSQSELQEISSFINSVQ